MNKKVIVQLSTLLALLPSSLAFSGATGTRMGVVFGGGGVCDGGSGCSGPAAMMKEIGITSIRMINLGDMPTQIPVFGKNDILTTAVVQASNCSHVSNPSEAAADILSQVENLENALGSANSQYLEAVELYNEFNLAGFQCSTSLSLSAYLEIFNTACGQIKAKYPNLKVYTGGLASAGSADQSNMNYLDKNVDCNYNGVTYPVDAISFHPYTGWSSSTPNPGAVVSFPTIANHSIAITEWGCGYFWDSANSGTRCAFGSVAGYQNYFNNNFEAMTGVNASGQPVVVQANYFLGNQSPIGNNQNSPSSVSMFLMSGGGTDGVNTDLYTGFGNALANYPFSLDAGPANQVGTNPTPTPMPTQTPTPKPTATSTPPVTPAFYYFESTSGSTTLAMNAWGGAHAGATVGDYAKSASQNEQYFFNSLGQLQVHGTDLCVGLVKKGTVNGTELVLETCGTTAAAATDQIWSLSANNASTPLVGRVINKLSGRCLDINENNYAKDQALQIWDCHSPVSTNQTWTLKTSP
jgi:hypothetical protein